MFFFDDDVGDCCFADGGEEKLYPLDVGDCCNNALLADGGEEKLRLYPLIVVWCVVRTI